MHVRRSAPGATAGDPAPGMWRGRSPRLAPWWLAALPGRAARAGVDAAALGLALLLSGFPIWLLWRWARHTEPAPS